MESLIGVKCIESPVCTKKEANKRAKISVHTIANRDDKLIK